MAIARQDTSLVAQDIAPVFTKDVAPILYKNCTSCHRTGGIGPFSLMDYDSAKANVADIKDAVKSGYMPPWHAEGPHGTFVNDRRLTDVEKQLILRWIDGGAKKGDMKALPAKPVYASSWELGTPDAIVSMPADFVVPASGTVEYQYFTAPTNFTDDQWVQSLEILPGAREVVHHALVFASVPAAPGAAPVARPAGSPAPKPLFVRTPQFDIHDPPRLDTRNGPPEQLGSLIGTTAPGTNVLTFPTGTALRNRAGNFFNGALVLPAGAKDVAVPSELEPNETVKIWALFPHTHVRGTRWKYTVEKPDGTTNVVLDVPRYDFN